MFGAILIAANIPAFAATGAIVALDSQKFKSRATAFC